MEKKIKRINNLLFEYQPQIAEIQKILLRSVLSFLVGSGLGLLFNRKVILFLISQFDLKNVNVVLTSPYQFINLAVGISIVVGITTTIPVFVYYLLVFIRPALQPKEFDLIKKLIPTSIILFIIGCIFGIKIEQFVVSLYSQTTTDYSLSNFWDIESFLSQVMIMSFTMGLVFELPIILTILIKIKLLSVSVLSHQRRYVYAALLVFGVILPPTDILSLVMIVFPLFLLFECTLLLNRAN